MLAVLRVPALVLPLVLASRVVLAQNTAAPAPPVPPTPAAQPAPPLSTNPADEARRRIMARDLAEIVPLRVEVTISRYQASGTGASYKETKISSQPYVLSVNANDPFAPRTSLRMVSRVSVPNETNPAAAGTAAVFEWREAGTNIDCSARDLDQGRFSLTISVEDTVPRQTPSPAAGSPVFNTFKLTNTLVLRDGQSSQFATATDKFSGEIVRADVKMTVVK